MPVMKTRIIKAGFLKIFTHLISEIDNIYHSFLSIPCVIIVDSSATTGPLLRSASLM